MSKLKLPSQNTLISFTAMLMSTLTLIIFIYQTNIISTQSKLSVRPRLTFYTVQSQQDSIISFSQVVTNKGLGPAIFKEGFIRYKGEKHVLDFESFFIEKFLRLEEFGDIIQINIGETESALLPTERAVFFSFEVEESKVAELSEYLGLDVVTNDVPWNIEVQYSSMYEELWRISDEDNKPVPQ